MTITTCNNKKNPMYGKHHTDMAKKKIGDATRNRVNGMLGKKHSIETKKKIGLKNKGRVVSVETRKKLRNIHLGKKFTDEHKQKIGLQNKGQKRTIQHKEKFRQLALQQFKDGMPLKTKLKIKNSLLGRKMSKEWRNKIRIARIKYMKTHFICQDTSIELKIEKILQKLNVKYIHPYNFDNCFLCDFAIPDVKIIIECDGCYWHGCTQCYPDNKIVTKDKKRDECTLKKGWKTLRFWEHDINNDINKCMNVIQEYI